MAQADYFLKIDGIEGESKDHKHKGEIELLAWDFNSVNHVYFSGGGGGGAGKVDIHDLSFSAAISKATPKLALACSNGVHFPKAILTARKAGGGQQAFLIMTLSDVFVSSHQTGGTKVSKLSSIEKASLHFDKIEMEYKEQKHDGTLAGPVKAGWNIKQNTPV